VNRLSLDAFLKSTHGIFVRIYKITDENDDILVHLIFR
jgi:hypothetical protein